MGSYPGGISKGAVDRPDLATAPGSCQGHCAAQRLLRGCIQEGHHCPGLIQGFAFGHQGTSWLQATTQNISCLMPHGQMECFLGRTHVWAADAQGACWADAQGRCRSAGVLSDDGDAILSQAAAAWHACLQPEKWSLL